MVRAGSSSSVSTGGAVKGDSSDGGVKNGQSAQSSVPPPVPRKQQGGGPNDFFAFYAQLQQSCEYYSNLALRQMMMGYRDPVPVGGKPLGMGKAAGEGFTGLLEGDNRKVGWNSAVTAEWCRVQKQMKRPQVKVVVSEYDGDDNETDAAVNTQGSFLARRRKVNFADPLSTIKIKSPTPIHSIEELNMGHGDGNKTGFTSDSDVEGSDTDLFCNYVWRIQNGLPGQLQVPSTGEVAGVKKRKKRKKKKNKNSRQDLTFEENDDDDSTTWLVEEFDEDDPKASYALPLNEDDYEFISEIRLCGPPTEKPKMVPTKTTGKCAGGEACNIKKANEMKLLYGETGSARILKMEETLEQTFVEALKKIGGRKQ